MHRTREATVCSRWLVPFMRVTGQGPQDLATLADEGLGLRALADPEARIRARAALSLVDQAARRMRAPALGLLAAEQLAPGDFDALELALRACATVRDALRLLGRYFLLIDGAQRATLEEDGDRARWSLTLEDAAPWPAVANDFALASVCSLLRRYAQLPVLHEVQLRHRIAEHLAAYERAFPGAKVQLGSQCNALVFARASLDLPMRLAHAGLCSLYEAQVVQRVERFCAEKPTSVRVRHVLEERLRKGEAGIVAIARELGLKPSALRRELADEGTTYRKLRDELRHELAERYLKDKALSVSEVAFMLGFATVAAFSKAFRRVRAVPPSAYRASLNSA